MAKTVARVLADPRDLQALQEIVESLVRQAQRDLQGFWVPRDRQARQDPRVNRAARARWARRDLKGLRVPKGTRDRLLRPARPGMKDTT